MNQKNLAIILKKFYPYKLKLSVLDSIRGKIEIVPKPQVAIEKIWPGMIISFDESNKLKNISVAENIEILVAPNDNNSSYFFWLHHVLEICYYFLALDDPSPLVFNGVKNTFFLLIHNYFEKSQEKMLKKICVAYIFNLVGFYPKGIIEKYLEDFKKGLATVVDITDHRTVESFQQILSSMNIEDSCIIDKWISECISAHPNKNFFKTPRFLQDL